MNSNEFHPTLRLRERVLKLMESEESFGGPQSVVDLEKNLKISNGSSRSVLVKLYQSKKTERIGHGIYRIKNDSREYTSKKKYLQ